MVALRWIFFVPVSISAALLVGLAGVKISGHADYATHSLIETVHGMWFFVVRNAVSMFVLVSSAALVVPEHKKTIAAIFVVTGGLATLPWPEFQIEVVFPFVAWTSRCFGSLGALLVVFRLVDRLESKKPNQMTEPISGSVTPRAASSAEPSEARDARVAPSPPVAHR